MTPAGFEPAIQAVEDARLRLYGRLDGLLFLNFRG
jgi:hypothetical protein